jgi:phosphoribosylglycinamide formyltransferase-1
MKTAVLVSGTGTNLKALLDADKRGELAPAQIALVVSNVPDAPALQHAIRAEVPHVTIDHRPFLTREAFEQTLLQTLGSHGIQAIVLAGFMRVLTKTFVEAFPQKIINTHPALSPSFPGVHAAAQALAYGVKVTGCTVHFVDAGVDSGPIIFQAAVPILPDDDKDTLQARIQVEEHRLLPQALRLLARGALKIQGKTVRIQE